MAYFFIILVAVGLTAWNVDNAIRHPELVYAAGLIEIAILAGALGLSALAALFDLITWVLK